MLNSNKIRDLTRAESSPSHSKVKAKSNKVGLSQNDNDSIQLQDKDQKWNDLSLNPSLR